MMERNTNRGLTIGAFCWIDHLVMPSNDNPILITWFLVELNSLQESSDFGNAIIHLKCFDTCSKGPKNQCINV